MEKIMGKIMALIRMCIPDILFRICYKMYGWIFLLLHRTYFKNNRFSIKFRNVYMYIHDKSDKTDFDAHYVFHPAWAARIIAKNTPSKHVDIASTVNFASMLSAFVPVDFYEYQPSGLHLSNLTEKFADLYALPFADNSQVSLSCMHVVEHIGLGRYGDPIDADGDIKAAKELSRVLAFGGTLLFVVPVGKPRLCFNAHRIYSYEMILNMFPELTLKSFSLIDDQKNFNIDCDPAFVADQVYGCGCFEFTKNEAVSL